MIKNFKHKSLSNYWLNGQTKGLDNRWITKLRRILLALDAAMKPEDLKIPGWHFHQLIGERQATYSLRLTGNCRVTFMWDGQDAIAVNIEDYH